MIKKQLEEDLKRVAEELGFNGGDIEVHSQQNVLFGNYSSNIPLQLAKQKSENGKQTPAEIAKDILEKLGNPDYLQKAEIAGPGFINFFVKDLSLLENLETPKPQINKSQKYFIEFAQPNTHKAFHIGHLRNITLGESLSRLLEFNGNKVNRATYGSDIGLPVAKAIWGIEYLKEEYEKAKGGSSRAKAEFLGRAYALGAKEYESDEHSKEEINELNIQIYQKDPQIMPIWEETRQWSIDYFETIYQRVGTKFDQMFWESEVEHLGKKMVEQNIDKVFEASDGAIIFPGEKYGLHNRVFISSAGNPTYEAKELGLAKLEKEAFDYDEALHVVANEQEDYFKVLLKVLEFIDPDLAEGKQHISYGMVNLTSGKMSSRTGDVVTTDSLIDTVKEKVKEVMKESRLEIPGEVVEQVAIGAIKFTMLKYSPKADIAFDINQSVSLQGDSGPYLQYTYARTQSVLEKAGDFGEFDKEVELEDEEKNLLVMLGSFADVVTQAAEQYRPNLICTYLLDLAKEYNLFYQKYRIIQSEKKDLRLKITQTVGETLKAGLNLLGLEAPKKM